MDAKATLVIYALIRSVLETSDKKVSFFMNPPEFPVGQFKALSGYAEDMDGGSALYLLANMVNKPLSFPYIDYEAGSPLWTLLNDVLNQNGTPGRNVKAEDDPDYQRHKDLILVADESGIDKPSEAYRTYQEFRDEWFVISGKLGSKQVELNLKDPDDPTRPLVEDEIAKLAGDLKDCELRWEGEGRRSEIERALQVIGAAKSRSPERQWAQWQNALTLFVNKEGKGIQKDVKTQGNYAATAISPSGIEASDASWTKVSMERSDVHRLMASTPPELGAKLNPTGEPVEMLKLEFEWTTAGIVRPWFDKALFESPGWKFNDPNRLISDGAADPKGEFPYIASGVVLVRGIKATPMPEVREVRDHRGGGDPGGGVVVTSTPRGVVRDHRTPSAAAAPEPAPAPPTVFAAPSATVFASALPPTVFTTLAFAPAADVAPAVAADVPPAVAAEPAAAPEPAFAILRDRAFVRRHVMLSSSVLEALPTADAAAPAEAADDSPMLVGLICSPLKRSPNPDPAFFS